MKKNTGYFIIIGVLVFIIGCLSFLVTTNLRKKSVSADIKYGQYVDSLIKVNNQTDMKAQVNIVNDNYLAILVSSKLDRAVRVDADVKFFDEDGKEIAVEKEMDTYFFAVLDQNKYTLSLPLPDLNGKYAGNIEVKLTQQEFDNFDFYILPSEITFEETHVVNSDNTTTITVHATNHGVSNIPTFEAQVVALKDGKVVATNYFSKENFESNSTFTSDVILPFSDNGKALNYDELLIYSTDTNTVY